MLRLVTFTPAHFSLLSSWFSTTADIVQWAGPDLSFPLTDPQLHAFLAEAAQSPPRRKCWMAERDGTLLGHAQLGLDWRNGNALLSRVVLAPEARGQGLAVPMLSLVLDEAFSLNEIQRVELNVYPWNKSAIRTYERLGFQLEGTRRSSALVEGERWDTALMGLLRSELSHANID